MVGCSSDPTDTIAYEDSLEYILISSRCELTTLNLMYMAQRWGSVPTPGFPATLLSGPRSALCGLEQVAAGWFPSLHSEHMWANLQGLYVHSFPSGLLNRPHSSTSVFGFVKLWARPRVPGWAWSVIKVQWALYVLVGAWILELHNRDWKLMMSHG